MSQLEAIRHQFHDLIDQVDDETVLARYLGAIASEVRTADNESWTGVTPEEQSEILEAYHESQDPANWLSHDEVKRKYAQWLTR